MPVKNFETRQNNILIGAGEVYIDLFDADGGSTGERYLGDSVGATLAIATEEATVFSGDGAIATELSRVTRTITRTVNLTLHDISLENLGLFTVADVAASPDVAAMDETLSIKLQPGRWHQLGGSTNAAGVAQLAMPADKAAAVAAVAVALKAAPNTAAVQAVAVDRFAAGEAETKGQYIVDYARARIYIVPADHALYAAGGPAVGSAVTVTYDVPADAGRKQVRTATKQLKAAFRYIEDPADGTGRNVYAPDCIILPGGDLTLKDGRSTEQQIALAVAMLEPGGDLHALYIDGAAA